MIEQIKNTEQWEKAAPDESYSLYNLPEPSDTFPRSDTIAGTTCNMQIVGEYLNSQGDMEDPIDGTGAEYMYIAIDAEKFPAGKEVDFRSEIEDALDDVLQATGSGRVFGGALGFKYGYIDLLIFDGQVSADMIVRVIDDFGLTGSAKLIPFA